MLGDYRVTDQSISNIYDNGLLTKPTPLTSMFRSGQGGFITGYKFIGDFARKAGGLPENKELKETLELIERERSVEGQSFGQRAGNFISDMIGYGLSPPVLALGAVGGGIAKGVAVGARAIAPKAVVPFLERQVGTGIISGKPLLVGEIGERLAHATLSAEFAGIPMAFEEGSANVAHAMGGLGFGIGSIPILLGLRKGIRVKVETPKLEEILPEPKAMTEAEKWDHDVSNAIDTIENIEKRATKILQQEGFNVNPVKHEVEFNLLNESDVKNLQIAVTDSMTSDVSPSSKNYLIDYIVNNRIDEIRSNPKSQAMLRAYDDFMTSKMQLRESIISEADRLHTKNMEGRILNNSFLSQPEIQKAIKKLSREESHVSQLPFTLPENLEKKLRLEHRIAELKKKSPNKQTERRIEELQSKIPKVLTPKEELADIAHKLLTKKEYRHPLKSRSYQRLQELADHWPQARSLMDRVKLEEQFERQQMIKEALDNIRKEVELPIEKSANPDNVITYMKERMESMKPIKTPLGEKIKTTEQKIDAASKIPADLERTLQEQQDFVAELAEKAPNQKKEFEMYHNKVRQFKKSGKALEDLIKCILGAK